MASFKYLLYLISALAVAAAVYLYFLPTQAPELSEEDEEHEEFVALTAEQIEAHGITLAKAESGTVQATLSVPARIRLNQDKVMHLVPKVSGVVSAAHKWVGEPVALGEVLAVFESAEMAQAKSKYLDTLKKDQAAAKTLEREKQLHEKRISAVQDYQNALAEADSARIELELARQNLHTMGLSREEIIRLPDEDSATLRRYELKSPMRGVIMEKAITKGELIDTSREIYVVADPTSLWAELYLFPSDFSLLSDGLELQLQNSEGHKIGARILSISPNVDPSTGALSIVASFENPHEKNHGQWRQGIYAVGLLKGKASHAALIVPKEALQQIEGEPTLFVRKEEGFEVRPVKTGRCDNSCVEILNGLSPGEWVATKNSFILKADHGKHEAEHMD